MTAPAEKGGGSRFRGAAAVFFASASVMLLELSLFRAFSFSGYYHFSHLIIGTADTLYLDGGARRLEAAMRAVGAKTGFRFVPGRSHFDLYQVGDDRHALTRMIAWEMYKLARPNAVVPANLTMPEVEPGH